MMTLPNGEEKFIPGYTPRVITDHALSFLKHRETGATHSPWEGHPERLLSKYRDCPSETSPWGRAARLESRP